MPVDYIQLAVVLEKFL